MATARSRELRTLAQRVADALPAQLAEEVVLTGSVSRGMADELSDIEMLVVTRQPLELEDCFALARGAGLEQLGTWGPQGGPTRRVSGCRERVALELIWWPLDHAERQIEALLAGAMASTADALAHGIALRTSGRLAAWQERLRAYPPDLAAEQIEQAALPWGGFAPAGLLTLVRPGDRLALTEWMVEAAGGVLTIVFALNGVWRPTTKRLAVRVAPLPIKPDRLAERIEEALTESDPRRALRVMTELQLETVLLAPGGPNVDRARTWLAAGANLLRAGLPSPVCDARSTAGRVSSPADDTARVTIEIRDAWPGDWDAIWPFFAEIVRAGETYAYDPSMSEEEARELWMVGPPGRTVVAVDEDGDIVGTANMYANRPGGGAHVASASFMVDPRRAGRGIGRALGERVLAWAKEAGFRAVQFNAVVETNTRAVALWRSLGFEIVGTVPEAFRHPDDGYVGLHVMHRRV